MQSDREQLGAEQLAERLRSATSAALPPAPGSSVVERFGARRKRRRRLSAAATVVGVVVVAGFLAFGGSGDASTELIAANADVQPEADTAPATTATEPPVDTSPASTTEPPPTVEVEAVLDAWMTVADVPGTSWTPIEMTGFASDEGIEDPGFAWLFFDRYMSAPLSSKDFGRYLEYGPSGLTSMNEPAELIDRTINGYPANKRPMPPADIVQIFLERTVDLSFPADQLMLMSNSDKSVLFRRVGSYLSGDDLDGSAWTLDGALIEFVDGEIVVEGFDPVPYTSYGHFLWAPGSPIDEPEWPFDRERIPVLPVPVSRSLEEVLNQVNAWELIRPPESDD